MSNRHLIIGIPSSDMVYADFAMSLVMVTQRAGVPFELVNSKGSFVAEQRNQIVSEARSVGGTHLLFLDSDMKLPFDTAARLLAHGKDIVGATYVTRTPPHSILGYTFDGKPVQMRSGLHQMRWLPTGCLLIDMKVFQKLDLPYFKFTVKGNLNVGEDLDFCERARNAGFEIYCDMDLSNEIGHIGSVTHTLGEMTTRMGSP